MTSLTILVPDLQQSGEKNPRLWNFKKAARFVKNFITIEPMLCCYVVAEVMSGPALNNLQLEMACKANSKFNHSVCEAVVTATHGAKNVTAQNSVVQQHISDMLAWSIPVQSVLPVLLLLFFGSYSDRHKIRKPFLLLPVLGEIIATLCYIVCTYFMETWPVAGVGVAYTVSSFFGSSAMLTMAAFAFIADISTQEMRIVRMSVIQVCLSVCVPVALTFSGVLFNRVGYVPSFFLGLALYVVAFFYGVALVKEPRRSDENASFRSLVGDVGNPQHALETLRLLKNTRGAQRTNIICILIIVFILAIVIGGEDTVFFYFAQHAYGWDYAQYTIFLAVWTVLNSIGLAMGTLILSKVLHLDDLIMIIISFVGKIVANIIFITVKSTWGLYTGLLAGILQDVGVAGARSQSTKYVSEDDIGKSQSLLSIVEAVAYALAAQIYHQGIYTYTRDTHIQAFFYVAIALFSAGIAILIWQYFNEKRQVGGEPARGEEEKRVTRM